MTTQPDAVFAPNAAVGGEISDQLLLARFVADRDEAAFAGLVQRHSRAVWGVCGRFLGRREDREDAFQAVFLVLCRKAASIRKGTALASWLYGVAYRIAMKARRSAARRHAHETEALKTTAQPTPSAEVASQELQRALDEEVQRLAEKYRAPFVLCFLEGMSRIDAARELGVPEGTLSGRLARARLKLQKRLARRGITLSAVLTAVALVRNSASAAVPETLVRATAAAALAATSGDQAATRLSPLSLALAAQVSHAMNFARIAHALALLIPLMLLAGAAGLGVHHLRTHWRVAAAPKAAAVKLSAVQIRGRQPVPGPVRTLPVVALAFSPDGTRLAAVGTQGDEPGQLKIWDVAEVRERVALPEIPPTSALAFSPDGNTIACGELTGRIALRDARTGAERAALEGHDDGITSMAFSRDGAVLASAGPDRAAKLWDAKTLKLNQELVGHSDKVVAVAFFRHGRAVATASEDHTARIWDVETGKERMILRGHSGPVDCVVASPDDAMIATAGRDARDSTVRLWDVNTGAEVAVLGSNPDAVRALAFTADGKFLAAAAGKTILFWDVHTRQVAARLAKQSGVIPTLAISPDGLYLANGSPFGLVLHAVQVVDDDAGANTWQEYVQSFKGLTECPPGWVVKAEENEPFVRFEPDGLRVSLPAGRPGNQRGTGVSCWQAVKGDFEITFNFEILHEPAPKDAGSPHTRVSMEILLERPKPWRNAAAITRKVTAGGTGFACWSVLIDDEDEAKEAIRNGGIATAAKTGRLRLKRAGALLSYYVAEGFDGEFTLLRQFPFGKEPLKEIRLVASTGGPKAAIDVRITDLLVRAESLPDLADIQPVAADPTSDGLWLWTGILLAAAVALSLGIWRYVRRRRAGQGSQSAGTPAPGAEMVSLACGTCGRALRAAATDLGKKLKCPHCGGAVASNKPP